MWRREQGIWIVESNVVGHCSHHHHHHHHCLHCDSVITLIIIIVIISRCHHYHCCHNYPPPTNISVVVNILFQFIFIFPLFLCMVMYANEFKTKEKQKLTEIIKKNNCSISFNIYSYTFVHQVKCA